MDIAAHLAYHDSAIRAWVFKHIGERGELNQDAYQNIRLAMIEFHAGGYDHSKGELLTVLWPYLRGIAFRGYKDEYVYGVKHDLDTLQEIAEQAHGRYGKDRDRGDKIHLDTLYESPIDGLRTPKESTLPPEEEKLAEILRESLTPEEWEILVVSYGESERNAAHHLGMPKTTYRERLARARERAKAILDDA